MQSPRETQFRRPLPEARRPGSLAAIGSARFHRKSTRTRRLRKRKSGEVAGSAPATDRVWRDEAAHTIRKNQTKYRAKNRAFHKGAIRADRAKWFGLAKLYMAPQSTAVRSPSSARSDSSPPRHPGKQRTRQRS